MRIADIVVAAATIAGRRQFFSRPGLARAELANEVRLGQGSLTGGVRNSIDGQVPHQYMLGALRPVDPAA